MYDGNNRQEDCWAIIKLRLGYTTWMSAPGGKVPEPRFGLLTQQGDYLIS